MVQICRERRRKTFGETSFPNRSRNERMFAKHASPKIWCRAIRKHFPQQKEIREKQGHMLLQQRKHERKEGSKIPNRRKHERNKETRFPQQRKHERKKETRFHTEKTREKEGNTLPQQKEPRFPYRERRKQTVEKEIKQVWGNTPPKA